MSGMPEPRELEPVAAGLIQANLTGDKFTTDRISHARLRGGP